MATNRFLVVAKYAVGSNRGLKDIQLVDTRVQGGGIKEDLVETFKGSYPQVRWFHDIGHYDGTPFPGASAVLVDLPASLLEANGGVLTKAQIDSIVKHHLSFGVYPVIRFYCTNTGLIKHETVTDSSGAGDWVVSEGLTCPAPDGEVLCIFEPTTTTSTSTTTTTTAGCGPPLDHFCDNSIDPLWTVDVNSPGTATEPPGTDFVVTGGSGILASNSCAAVSGAYKTYSGDFDVTAVVSDIDGVNMWQYCGLVGRIDDINFVYACVPDLITKVQGNHCTAGSGNGDNEFWDGTFPLYIRIARVSNDFYIYISNNGSSWTEIVPPITRLSDSRDCQVWLHSGYLSGLGSPQTIKFDWFGNTTDIPDDW